VSYPLPQVTRPTDWPRRCRLDGGVRNTLVAIYFQVKSLSSCHTSKLYGRLLFGVVRAHGPAACERCLNFVVLSVHIGHAIVGRMAQFDLSVDVSRKLSKLRQAIKMAAWTRAFRRIFIEIWVLWYYYYSDKNVRKVVECQLHAAVFTLDVVS